MTKTEIVHKFKLQDKVKHITKGSPEGVVIDFEYHAFANYVEYMVTWAAVGSTAKFYENELTKVD